MLFLQIFLCHKLTLFQNNTLKVNAPVLGAMLHAFGYPLGFLSEGLEKKLMKLPCFLAFRLDTRFYSANLKVETLGIHP